VNVVRSAVPLVGDTLTVPPNGGEFTVIVSSPYEVPPPLKRPAVSRNVYVRAGTNIFGATAYGYVRLPETSLLEKFFDVGVKAVMDVVFPAK
jgi:hypothetical protein